MIYPKSFTTLVLLSVMLLGSGFLHAAQTISATIIKRGNVRYGPNLKAGVICTLRANSKIEIISRAEGLRNWYKIKFPRQGLAWMHKRNLVKTSGRMMRVTLDGAVVRSDATTGGDVVAELKLNEVIEWKGPQVGSWYAVFVPSAVAYVHQSVVMVDQPIAAHDATGQAEIIERPVVRVPDAAISHPAEDMWKQAKITYEKYYAILQADTSKGLNQDWAGLSKMLTKIVIEHPQLKTKVYAERLRKGIARLVSGTAPAPIIKKAPVVTQLPAQRPVVEHADVVTKNPVVKPVVGKDDPADLAGFAKTENGVVGWLESKEIESIGVSYVILGDSGIAAFIKLQAGSRIDLKTMHWRRVIASGETQIVDHLVSEEYKGIPLLILEKIHLKQ